MRTKTYFASLRLCGKVLLLVLIMARLVTAGPMDDLQASFVNPPDDARIMMRWWWFGPAVDNAQLEREMRLMKEGGIVSTLDPATGQILKQGRTPNALEEYYASPVAGDGKIFVVSASGKVTVLKADAQWEILATSDLDEEVWATPAIAGGNLYIRTRNALYAFAASTK